MKYEDIKTSTNGILIVLFGPSGVGKAEVSASFERVCKKRLPKRTVQSLDIGAFLEKSTHIVLGNPPRVQQDQVSDAINKIAKRRGDKDLTIVRLHACHLCGGIPVFPLSTEAISSLRPDICLTVFDDVYASKKALEGAGYPYRYETLLNWRVIECGVGDHLAAACGVENIYLAAKHPAITAYRLVFQPEIPRLYSASQITAVRNDPALRNEIEEHRRRLHKEYTVFDPLTIDDRVLVNSLPASPTSQDFQVSAEARWPSDLSDLGEDYASLVAEDRSIFPIAINTHEAQFLNGPLEQSSYRSPIDTQIRSRDFRYIEQSDVMAAYRPRLGGHESSGVAAEKTYAAGMGKTPVVEFSPPDDTRGMASKAFSTPLLGPACTTKASFYDKLSQVAAEEAKRRCNSKADYYARFIAFRD